MNEECAVCENEFVFGFYRMCFHAERSLAGLASRYGSSSFMRGDVNISKRKFKRISLRDRVLFNLGHREKLRNQTKERELVYPTKCTFGI